MLRLEHLTKKFAVVSAVHDVSLSIPQGQMVGIIGRSGVGKTTLLRLINRLAEPTCGRIVCDGQEVSAFKGRAFRAWRARCAMVFQQFHLVPRLDVVTNVLLGRLSYTNTLLSLINHFTASRVRLLVVRCQSRVG